MSVLVHTDMSTTHIARNGTPEQKEKYLRPLITGEHVCAIAVSEPSGGSDVAGIQTTAVKDGDTYVINGAKIFITNSVHADTFWLLCIPYSGHRKNLESGSSLSRFS